MFILPMVELLVGTVLQQITLSPRLSARFVNLFSMPSWCSLSKKKMPVAYWPKGGSSIWWLLLKWETYFSNY